MFARHVATFALGVCLGSLNVGHAQQLVHAIEYGMNPAFHGWAEREIVFADAMTRAHEFGYVANDVLSFADAALIPLGQGRVGEGWPDPALTPPGERPGAALFNVMEGTLPDGRTHPYVVTWRGDGSCKLVGPAILGEGVRTFGRVPVFIDPTAAGGNALVVLVIDESSPANPVRDVRVWLPGMEGTGRLFWPPYLARLKAMNRVVGPHTWRTLDWSRTNLYGAQLNNGAFDFDLAGVITPRSPSQGTRRGVCVEYQVALCNKLGANLHLTVPHRTNQLSTGEYGLFLWGMFRRIRDGSPALQGINGDRPFAGLDRSLTLTIELSNEIWNPDFPVHHWMRAEAEAKGLTIHEQVASQLQFVFAIADFVFASEPEPRVRRFIGGHIASSTWLRLILEALPNGYRIDAAGPAGYFGPRRTDVAGWLADHQPGSPYCPNCPTTQTVLDVTRASIADLRLKLRATKERLDSYTNPDGSHPQLELYEAGASFVWGQQPWAEAGAAVQVHPALYYMLVDDYIPMLIEEGVDLVNWYCLMTDQNSTAGWGDGPFGIWNDMEQPLSFPVPEVYHDQGAPKAAAIYRGPPLVPGGL